MDTPITFGLAGKLLNPRPVDAHKGTFGHVFILAGSRGFTGAAKLAAEGALRSGAGLVTVGTPRSLADIVASSLLEAMSLPLPSTQEETFSKLAVEKALEFARDKQAVVLGPGVSQHPETREFVLEFIKRCPVSLLIDADGLNCLSADTAVLTRSSASRIVTPHPGEMGRLMQTSAKQIQQNRSGAALQFARSHACTVVLKGYRTVVADAQGEVFINPTGNSGMASGGTGDVLSGVIGGLMAQGSTPTHAAILGVFLHGLAGDLAAETATGRGLLARDLLAAIPEAWRRIENYQAKPGVPQSS